MKRGEITLKTIIWDLKMLTFIDGEPLKARLLLRGSTVSSCCSEGKQNQRVYTRLPQLRVGGQGLCLRSLDFLGRSSEAKVSHVEGG